jgi:hypothetical protein
MNYDGQTNLIKCTLFVCPSKQCGIGCTSWREDVRRFIVHVLLALEGSLEPAIGIRDKNEELRKERSSTVQNAFCESRQDRNGKSDLLQIPTNRPSTK